MKSASLFTLVLAVQFTLATWTTLAHPGSGIVVDNEGKVFFQDGRAVWMIDTGGRLTKYSDKLGGHWMTLDANGSFARADVKVVERITTPGVKPALLVADGGAPVAVGGDGNLYYALRLLEDGGVETGITRISPDGKQQSRFVPDLEKDLIEKHGITGLAAGPDGSLYVACPSAVLKLKIDGTVTTLAHPIVLKDCDVDYPDHNPSMPLPALRVLAVDEHGTVFAAAVGCHAVVRITTESNVETMLKAERPWSPTGVAVHQGEVYVLEYTNANGGPDEGWQPRVRRLGRDGKVATLAIIPRDGKQPER